MSISPIEPGEQLALYVTQEQDPFNDGQLTGNPFVPRHALKDDKRLETSIIRYGNRSSDEMKNCGSHWAKYVKQSFLGIAQVSIEAVRMIPSLNVEHTPRKWESLHSDIINWDLKEPQYRLQAEKLARKANFISV